jgi:predicted DNA-binding protein (MmcQ/YjbR family)
MSVSEKITALKAVLEAKPGAVGAPLPSAPGVLLYKVMGKMFAILSTRGEAYLILKCDPHLAEILREQYAGVGHRSHLDRRFWIAVTLDADVPPDEIERLVDGSHDLVRAGLTRKQKAELEALSA